MPVPTPSARLPWEPGLVGVGQWTWLERLLFSAEGVRSQISEGIALLIAKLILADAASIADGKLYMLGGGWTITGPQPISSAVVLLVDSVEPRETKRHECEIMLLHADGSPAAPAFARTARYISISTKYR